MSAIVSMHSIRRVDDRRRDMDQGQWARGRFWTLCRMNRRLRTKRRRKFCRDGGLFLISSRSRVESGTRLMRVTSRRVQKKRVRRRRRKTVSTAKKKKKKKKSKSRTHEFNNNNAGRGAAGRCGRTRQARQVHHNNSANDKAISAGPLLPLRIKPARPWRDTSTTLTTHRRPRTSPPRSLLLWPPRPLMRSLLSRCLAPWRGNTRSRPGTTTPSHPQPRWPPVRSLRHPRSRPGL